MIERHETVPKDLRHDGGAGDHVAATIAVNKRPAGSRKRWNPDPIHQQEIDGLRKILDGAAHRFKGCAKDIGMIDPLGTDDAEADLGMVEDDPEGPLTLRRRQPF